MSISWREFSCRLSLHTECVTCLQKNQVVVWEKLHSHIVFWKTGAKCLLSHLPSTCFFFLAAYTNIFLQPISLCYEYNFACVFNVATVLHNNEWEHNCIEPHLFINKFSIDKIILWQRKHFAAIRKTFKGDRRKIHSSLHLHQIILMWTSDWPRIMSPI